LGGIDVDWGQDWDKAIFRSGKDSNPDLYLFDRTIAEQYRSPHKGVKKHYPSLVVLSRSWRAGLGLDLLTDRGLQPAHPRVAFSVGEKMPDLPSRVGLPFVGAISLVPCSFRIGDNQVQFVTRTFVSDIWRESRLTPGSYIFEAFCGILAEEIASP
jgi:hypothetical protein